MKMTPTNGGQGTSKSSVKTSEPKGKLAKGKDLRQTPSGGNKATR